MPYPLGHSDPTFNIYNKGRGLLTVMDGLIDMGYGLSGIGMYILILAMVNF
jgi:hypothetical protein